MTQTPLAVKGAIRSFIAVELPRTLQSRLGELIQSLSPNAGRAVRWVQPGNIHLTLQFLGDVSPVNLLALEEMVVSEMQRHANFELTIAQLGAFPSIHRPRVIWVGVENTTALKQLHRSITTQTYHLGYTDEERDFNPHLTLGRMAQSATPADVQRVGEALTKMKVEPFGSFSVRSVTLFRSDLQPGGSVYTQLLVAPFGKDR